MNKTTGTTADGREFISTKPPILSADGRSILRYTTYSPTVRPAVNIRFR